jgi:hypothetical protein
MALKPQNKLIFCEFFDICFFRHGKNLVRFAPPAIARHARAGHNWNTGKVDK